MAIFRKNVFFHETRSKASFLPCALYTFKEKPVKGDTLTIDGQIHRYKRTKLKKIASEIRKTFGRKFSIEEQYRTVNHRKLLTLKIGL